MKIKHLFSFFSLAILIAGASFLVLGGKNEEIKIGGDFLLTDQNQRQISLANLKGKYSLLFFGFTKCPSICPTGLATISQAFSKLNSDQKAQLNLVFISLDPERDTPEILKNYMKDFAPEIIALTGPPSEIKKLSIDYGIYYKKQMMPDNSSYMIDHSNIIYFLNKKGKFLDHLQGDVSTENLYQKLLEIL